MNNNNSTLSVLRKITFANTLTFKSMKKILLTLLCAFLCIQYSWGQLNAVHNRFRNGDILIKQQVEFKNPEKKNGNDIWDFGQLKAINNEYTLSYELPPMEGDSIYIFAGKRINRKNVEENELIVGTEHSTMYYYQLRNDSLLQIGHDNLLTQLYYVNPMVVMIYPLNYGQSISSEYRSQGLYSGSIKIETKGTITTTADAYGKMILPSGDTINPVLRVKTIQSIIDIPNENSISADTLSAKKGRIMETCRWYTKGYRYPIFETVRSINLIDSLQTFGTAFYYPPQEHLYIDTDPENHALLEEMWQLKNKEIGDDDHADGKTISIEDIISCKIYPNPVHSTLTMEYEIKKEADITFDLYSIEGMPVKKISSKHKLPGTYYELVDCSGLFPQTYVLRITANNLVVNEIIIKK